MVMVKRPSVGRRTFCSEAAELVLAVTMGGRITTGKELKIKNHADKGRIGRL
jgi:hypothetical protein